MLQMSLSNLTGWDLIGDSITKYKYAAFKVKEVFASQKMLRACHWSHLQMIIRYGIRKQRLVPCRERFPSNSWTRGDKKRICLCLGGLLFGLLMMGQSSASCSLQMSQTSAQRSKGLCFGWRLQNWRSKDYGGGNIKTQLCQLYQPGWVSHGGLLK